MEPQFENVQIDSDSSFCGLWFSCPSLAEDHTWHYHPEFELTWVVRSQGTRFVGDSIEPYQANDLVLLGPNLPHCWHDDAGVGLQHPEPEVVVLQFRSENFGGEFLKLPELGLVNTLLRACARGLHVRGDTALRVRALMQEIFQKKGLERLLQLLEILQTLAQSPVDLRALASADYYVINDISQTSRQRIELIHRYVRQNLKKCDLSQAEVAALIGLTPAAFSRFFRKATGQTFVGFVNILRINEVCRLLMQSDACIADIAMNCGYNNIANFNRQFLAIKRMNPRRYREQRNRILARQRLTDSLDGGGPTGTARGNRVSMANWGG